MLALPRRKKVCQFEMVDKRKERWMATVTMDADKLDW